jgi:uncharacterized protein (DUF433 family)
MCRCDGTDADKLQSSILVLHEHIIRDPKTCGGQPVFRGTRVTLRAALASLAEGDSVGQLLESFSTLTEGAVRAAIAFAAASALEDLPPPPTLL